MPETMFSTHMPRVGALAVAAVLELTGCIVSEHDPLFVLVANDARIWI